MLKSGSVGAKFGLVLVTLVMFSSLTVLFPLQSEGSASQPEYELSITVLEGESPLQVELFTINSTGSYRSWTLDPLNANFDASWLDDIDGDKNLEFLGLAKESFLNVYDLATNQLQWQLKLPFTDSVFIPFLFATDLNGDGTKEIILSKLSSPSYASIWNETVLVINHEGNIIQRIYRDDPQYIRYYGADNIRVLPTENGKNALIISYGSSAYNTTILSDFDGAYVLERWDWNETENRLTRTWQATGPDTGGNTRLGTVTTIDGKTIIITAGWYNNPLRAFNATDGLLLWERKLRDIEDVSTIQKMSDPELTYYENGQQSFLLVGANSYTYVFPSKLFILDPLTGKDVLPPREFDRASITKPGADDKGIIVLNKVHPDLDNPDSTIWKARTLDPVSLEPMDEIPSPGAYFASIPAASQWRTPYETAAVAVGTDTEGKLWLITPNGAFPIGRPVGSIRLVTISTSSIVPGKELIYSYTDDLQFNRLISKYGLFVITTFLLVFLVGMILASRKYYERKKALRGEKIFDEYWESIDWKSYFVVQLNRIFGENKSNGVLSDGSTTPRQPPKGEKSIFIVASDAEPIVETYNNERSGQIIPIPPNFPHLRSWINNHASFAQKIKISDIALMIEVYNVHPDRPTRKDIVAKFKFVPQSTLYGRIKKLEAFGLLRSNQLINQVNDMRYGLLELTEAGKELLQAIHISFNSTTDL